MSDNDIFQGGSEPRGHYVLNFGHFEASSALINHNYNRSLILISTRILLLNQKCK